MACGLIHGCHRKTGPQEVPEEGQVRHGTYGVDAHLRKSVDQSLCVLPRPPQSNYPHKSRRMAAPRRTTCFLPQSDAAAATCRPTASVSGDVIAARSIVRRKPSMARRRGHRSLLRAHATEPVACAIASATPWLLRLRLSRLSLAFFLYSSTCCGHQPNGFLAGLVCLVPMSSSKSYSVPRSRHGRSGTPSGGFTRSRRP